MAENKLMGSSLPLPDTSMYASSVPDSNPLAIITGLQQVQNARTANQIQQFDLANRQLGTLRNTLGSLAAKPDLSYDDIISHASNLVANGIVPQAMATREIMGAQTFANDPEKLRGFVTNHLVNVADAHDRLNQAGFGPPQTDDIGDAKVTRSYNPQRHSFSGVGNGVVATGMSPDAKAAPRTGVAADGSTYTAPTSSTVGRTGIALPPAQASASSAGAPTSMAPAGVTVPGAVATSQAPGVKEAATATGQQSGEQLAADRKSAADYQRTIFPLTQAIPALERLGTTGTGPGTEQFNQIKSFLQSAGLPGLDTSKIKDFDEVKKYLTDFVNQNGNTGTNDKLAAAFAGNPSVGISNAAAADVAKSALALQRMKQARTFEFANSGLPDAQYGQFAAKFATQQDPRAYGYDMMSAPAQQKMLSAMTPAEKERFVASLRVAHRNSLLNGPSNAP